MVRPSQRGGVVSRRWVSGTCSSSEEAIPAAANVQTGAQPVSSAGDGLLAYIYYTFTRFKFLFYSAVILDRPVPLILHLPWRKAPLARGRTFINADCEGRHSKSADCEGRPSQKRWIRVPNRFVLPTAKRCENEKKPETEKRNA